MGKTLCLFLGVLGCAGLQGNDSPEPLRVVYLIGGIAHDYDNMPEALVREVRANLERAGRDVAVEVTRDLAALDGRNLARTDLLMMNICQQSEVSLERRRAFLDAVREGLPIVALHCTLWSFQAWPEFRQVLGAFVPGHARFGPMCVRLTSDAGDLGAGLPEEFELIDEPYYVDDRDPAMQIIATTCSVYNDSNGNARAGVEPGVWIKSFGKGRVFAMTFGHNMQSQGSDSYRRLFNNGVRWALRMD